MFSRFRLALFLILFAMLLASGCIPKQKLPLFQPRSDAYAWLNDMAALSPAEQGNRAYTVWKDASAPQAVRERALSILASRPGDLADTALAEMHTLYTQSPAAQRSAWENMFWSDLSALDDVTLRARAMAVSEEQTVKFPWNLLLLRASRHSLLPDSMSVMSRVAQPMLYANPVALGISATQAAASGPVRVVLALPQSSSGAALLGRQITLGAMAASDVLRAQGRHVDIRVIDTDQDGWELTLRSLPPQYTVVGGSLIASTFPSVLEASSGRAVFSFSSALPDGVEGRHAWRFFTSAEDQIETLLDTAEAMDIRSVGIFTCPSENYSVRMSKLFKEKAEKRGFRVTSGTYTAGEITEWPKESAEFLQTEVGEQRGSIPVATAEMDAIFLPDVWKNMDMLISSLHYNGAHTKLMLGTSIWEQSLSPKTRNNAAAFGLTVFPGAWNAKSTAAGSEAFRSAIAFRGGEADDWAVLGFDFVQATAGINLQPDWTPDLLNERLAKLRAAWAGAPMQWNANGQAHRKLFLLRPAVLDCETVSLSELKARFQSGNSALSSTLKTEEVDPQVTKNLDKLLESITNN